MAKIDHTFQEALSSYLSTKNLDDKTTGKYMFYFHKLINLYPDLNQKNIDLFLTYNSNPPARAMIKNLKSAIIRWDFPKEVKEEVSILDIPKVTGKGTKKIPKFMKKSDLDKLEVGIKTNDGYRDETLKLMILTQFYAGLRVNELINLTFDDLDYEHRVRENRFQTIKISSDSAKFGKERQAHIPTELYKRLIVLHNENNRRRKNYNSQTKLWIIGLSRYKALLRSWSMKILDEPYNTHSLRHGRGYDLTIQEGKSIEFVKKYLGHADIKSTQIYTHLGDEDVTRELEE